MSRISIKRFIATILIISLIFTTGGFATLAVLQVQFFIVKKWQIMHKLLSKKWQKFAISLSKKWQYLLE